MRQISFLAILILLGTSCLSNKYLPKPSELKQHTKGLYIDLKLNGESSVLGEIIEVNPEEVNILPIKIINSTVYHGALTTIKKEQINRARIGVATISDNPKKIKNLATTASVISIGHGWFAIITLPSSLAIGISTVNGSMSIRYPMDISWDQMNKFARFPQGIPKSINPINIK